MSPLKENNFKILSWSLQSKQIAELFLMTWNNLVTDWMWVKQSKNKSIMFNNNNNNNDDENNNNKNKSYLIWCHMA